MPLVSVRSLDRTLSLDVAEAGEGHPVLLIHGFASRKEVNWIDTGWVRALTAAGFRTVAFDNRGHGGSDRPLGEEAYSLDVMAADALGLIEALDLQRPHVIGYSMGARITARLAMDHGERLGRLVLGGNGWGMVEGSGDWSDVRDGLLAEDAAAVTGERARAFRTFADQTRSDRQALAACVAGVRQLLPLDGLSRITNPVLVAVGTRDDVAGSGERLAAALPDAIHLPIEGRDHMKAVGDRRHVAGAVAFLRGEPVPGAVRPDGGAARPD